MIPLVPSIVSISAENLFTFVIIDLLPDFKLSASTIPSTFCLFISIPFYYLVIYPLIEKLALKPIKPSKTADLDVDVDVDIDADVDDN